ncbi:hypothetical protein BJ741DRAFT_704099 [Chytriomyces cf. hyalinus JEL632]|nr:hypothetical protein BJ741DRAFT_704099 [Chytriomyces cf. hyalinus JEL632]
MIPVGQHLFRFMHPLLAAPFRPSFRTLVSLPFNRSTPLLRTAAVTLQATQTRPTTIPHLYSPSRRLSAASKDSGVEIYTGAIGKAIQALKRVSVVSLVLTWSTTPLFWYTAMTNGGGASVAAISVMVGALIVSSLSTSLIHWCCKPYVTSIASSASTPRTLTITRINFFGSPYATTLPETDLRVTSGRMFTTWETVDVSSKKKQLYYVHSEAVEKETEMGAVIDGVLRRGLLNNSAYSDGVSSAPGSGAVADAKKENWDEVVKRLREKKD